MKRVYFLFYFILNALDLILYGNYRKSLADFFRGASFHFGTVK